MLPILMEGLKLMSFGMGIVFLYLILLVYAIKLISYFFSGPIPEPVLEPATASDEAKEDSGEMVAIITAAIIAHKNKNS